MLSSYYHDNLLSIFSSKLLRTYVFWSNKLCTFSDTGTLTKESTEHIVCTLLTKVKFFIMYSTECATACCNTWFMFEFQNETAFYLNQNEHSLINYVILPRRSKEKLSKKMWTLKGFLRSFQNQHIHIYYYSHS
jgi:hypothetical protein